MPVGDEEVVATPVSVQPVRTTIHRPSGTCQSNVPSPPHRAVRSTAFAGSSTVADSCGGNGLSGVSTIS